MDCDTDQPVCFTLASSSATVTEATPDLLTMAAEHFARNLFQGLEGDIRVSHDTALVTYYNAPNAELLRTHYEGLPEKLRQQGIDPRIPWLYDFHLDFRFK